MDSDKNIIIHPRKGRKEKQIPENGLLLVNPTEASECHRRLKESGGKSRFLFNSSLVVADNSAFFLAGPAIGAPMAALSMEKLIALGAKRIILIGWCGALSKSLKVGDVLVPDGAQSGEGTSKYYVPVEPVGPNLRLTKQVENLLGEKGVPVHQGCVWSTDALYREDRVLLKKLNHEKGVVAIDMEFSALCAVALFRKIEFTAVLTVSDELWGESWRPGFSAQKFLEQKETALNILLEHVGMFGEE